MKKKERVVIVEEDFISTDIAERKRVLNEKLIKIINTSNEIE